MESPDPTNFQVLDDIDNIVAGGTGSDIIVGGSGNDLITDAGGPNFLVGGLGNDTIVGGPEDDSLLGNQGSDTLIGGAGNDVFEIFVEQNVPGEIDTIVDFEPGSDVFVIVGGTEVSYDNDSGTLSIDGNAAAVLDPGLDLNVLAREDSFLVFSNGDTPLLTNSASRPQAEVTNVPAVPLLEGSTPIQFEANSLAGGLFAAGFEETNNVFLFGESDDVSVGGNQTDKLDGGAGDDHLAGFGGNDLLLGGLGDDVLQGDLGNDIIIGNQGSDLIYGGQGRDVFKFFANEFIEGELDVVLDFEQGLDSLIIIGSADVTYESNSGLLSVDGTEVAVIDTGLELNVFTIDNSAFIF
ncbi:MAG: calcium-binding protein [Symploca sp. SIO2E9]|nr:calcium-binding protein [Symploca sp. SIO2E9]